MFCYCSWRSQPYWGKNGGKSFDGEPQPQTRKTLTARFVRTIQTPGKSFDGHGLFLRVEPNGSRFRVQRILVRGKRRELSLGSPTLVTLAEAREKRIENRRIATTGGPPRGKRKSKTILTFEEAARKAHRDG
ncbi:Arm DNA-binding domain-containing protein [Aquamicrobium sp.]|uniref:Arm DNA-binding domain-containing protein n=1 Tax=Aquamicrobium sp. TaxID=1872579 RepID=UPI00349EAD87